MSIEKGVFLHSIPESEDYDYIRIYQASSETGTYSLVATYTYVFGIRGTEHDNIDTAKWYKIQFYNSSEAIDGPLSDAVYGGDFDKAKPFAALTTSFDGAGFASITDLYNRSNLTSADVPSDDVRRALKVARAYIDLVTGEQNLYRFSKLYDKDTARRKYNAFLEIIKECEIYFGLNLIYRNLADDKVMEQVRDNETQLDNVSIGQTSLTEGAADYKIKIAQFLDNQSERYGAQANGLLETILPTTVDIQYSDKPLRTTGPLNWDVFSVSTAAFGGGPELDLITEVLTGNGESMNDSWYNLSDTPLSAETTVEDAYLSVNGVSYGVDDYIDLLGNTVSIGGGTTGFSFKFDVDPVQIKWNNTTANGGFDLNNVDVISVRYWK